MSENSKNPLMAPAKPKKRHLWGLWIPLIVIFSLVVIPVGIAAILFYDNHHVETGITEKKDESVIFGSIMTDMFDGCRKESDQTIDLKITQQALNQLLYNASSNLPSSTTEYLKQFSVQILDDYRYTFDLEIGAFNFLKSHIVLQTKVHNNADLGNGEKGFLFEITDMKLGRLGNLEGLLPWISNTAGLDLSNILVEAGLHIVFDVNNLRLTYAYSDFVDDLSTMASSSDPLFINIFSNFFTQGIINFEHHKDTDVVGTVPMADFIENPDYTNSNYVRKPMVDQTAFLTYASNQVQSMIDDGIIAYDSDVTSNARTVLKFLTFGYEDYLNTSEKAYIDGIYSSIKANYCQNLEKNEYSAWAKTLSIGVTKSDLVNEVASAVNQRLSGHELEFLHDIQDNNEAYIYTTADPYQIPDSEIQNLLKGNKGLIGYGYSFVGKDDNNKAKMSYTVLDNVYPTIIPAKSDEIDAKDVMALTFGLNINGTETSLVMPMNGEEYHEGNVHGLSFNLKDAQLYFGTKSFPNLKDQLQDIINDINSSSDDMIQFVRNSETNNIEHIQMKLDFDKYFNDPEHAASAFKYVHETATTSYGAKLLIDFEFASASTDAPGKRSGLINVAVGYQRDA